MTSAVAIFDAAVSGYLYIDDATLVRADAEDSHAFVTACQGEAARRGLHLVFDREPMLMKTRMLWHPAEGCTASVCQPTHDDPFAIVAPTKGPAHA